MKPQHRVALPALAENGFENALTAQEVVEATLAVPQPRALIAASASRPSLAGQNVDVIIGKMLQVRRRHRRSLRSHGSTAYGRRDRKSGLTPKDREPAEVRSRSIQRDLAKSS